jgi:7,8-didemethyl-8-hydroxy-5-deazariboflavin synthase CofH subunit
MAGALYVPPLTSRAQTMRAILLARAVVTSMRASHEPAAAPRRLAQWTTALAPRISNRRMVRSPLFEMAPSLCLPPVDLSSGVSPSQAAKSRPARPAAGAAARGGGARAGGGGAAPRRGAGVLRADAADVYGDTALIAAATLARTSRAPARVDGDLAGILRRAEAGTPPTEDEALALLSAQGADLDALVAAADAVRAVRVGEVVTYVVNRNINFTNICYTGCRFCAFAQRRDDPDAYNLSLSQVADRAEQAWAYGATEVCLQGGIHPDLGGDYYFAILEAIKQRVPDIHIHAFSPMEVANGAARLGIGVGEWLAEAKRRGLGSIPGTAAEILDDDVRWVLTKGKLPTAQWIEVITTAHDLGIPTTSTMMYGHVDSPEHWVAHIKLIRSLQQRTLERNGRPGFTEFVLLPFVHTSAPIYLAGLARTGPTERENRAVHALARLLLHGAIDNIQCSWVKLAEDTCRALLRAFVSGADVCSPAMSIAPLSRSAAMRPIQAATGGKSCVTRGCSTAVLGTVMRW